MEARKNDSGRNGKPQGSVAEHAVYEQDTPRWRRYYHEVRKTIRFPRYYKKSVNW